MARSAHQPAYRISLGGQIITDRLAGRLASLRLTDHRGLQADQLDIRITDDDGRLALPRHGVELGVALGWHDTGLVDRGTFIVDEVEHSGTPDVIHIRARSANLRDSFKVKQSKSWHDVTLGDVVHTIAVRHDLKPKISTDLAGIRITHVDQTEESDLNFVTRLAQRFGAIAAIKSGYLLFVVAGDAATASGRDIPPITITRADGDNHRYSRTDRNSYTGVIAHYNDLGGAKRKQAIAGSKQNAKMLRPTYASEQDATHAAQAEWRRIQRGEATFEFTLADGNPALYPETPVVLSGFKPQIDARSWLLTEITHNLSATSYTSQIKLELGRFN